MECMQLLRLLKKEIDMRNDENEDKMKRFMEFTTVLFLAIVMIFLFIKILFF